MARLLQLLLMLLNISLFAQDGFNNNWVITNKTGYNFSTGSPIFFSANLNQSHYPRGPHALSIISDNLGNLLFYHSQDSVINANHQLMEKGDGLFNWQPTNHGYTSCILPHPANHNLYYIVYTSRNEPMPGTDIDGLFYAVVDLSHNNGLGKVVHKNALLDDPVVTSFVAPIYNDVQNRFEIHYGKLDNNGLNATHKIAIVDSTGLHTVPQNSNAITLGGTLSKWNAQATLLAKTGLLYPIQKKGILDLYAYNKHTGVLSKKYRLILDNWLGPGGDVAFSASGRYMYVGTSTEDSASLWRYDVFQPDSTSVHNSRVDLLTTKWAAWNKGVIEMMQLAPNQKIYFAVRPTTSPSNPFYLGVVNHPDSTYTANVDGMAISGNGQKLLALPNFIQQWNLRPPFSLRHACQDSVVFDLTYKNIVDSVYWDFGDPASGPANHSNLLSPVHHYTSYGAYWVQVTTCWQGECDTLADSVFVEPVPVVSLPKDTLLCAGESLFVDVGQGFNANYLWNTGSTDSTAVLDKTGQYIVHAYNNCGSHADTINISVIEPPVAQLKDTVACDNFQVVLHIMADSASYLWSTGATESTIYPTVSGTYTVEVQNPCGAIQDQATVTYKKCICNVYVANAFTPNNDGTNDFFKPIADCPEFSYTLYILDRWGNVVTTLNESTPGWDGTQNGQPAPNGVYTYRLLYKGREYERTIQKEVYGTVSLMR